MANNNLYLIEIATATEAGTKTIRFTIPTNCADTDKFVNDFSYLTISANLANLVNQQESTKKALDADEVENPDLLTAKLDRINKAINHNRDLLATFTNPENAPTIIKTWVMLANNLSVSDYVNNATYKALLKHAFTLCVNSKATKADKDESTKAINKLLAELFESKDSYFTPCKVSVNDTILDEVATAYNGAKVTRKASGQGVTSAYNTARLEKFLITQVLLQVAEIRLDFPETTKSKATKKVGFII